MHAPPNAVPWFLPQGRNGYLPLRPSVPPSSTRSRSWQAAGPAGAEQPVAKLRRLLHEARDAGSYIHSAGACDAFTAVPRDAWLAQLAALDAT